MTDVGSAKEALCRVITVLDRKWHCSLLCVKYGWIYNRCAASSCAEGKKDTMLQFLPRYNWNRERSIDSNGLRAVNSSVAIAIGDSVGAVEILF
jgi:hypothetical protein